MPHSITSGHTCVRCFPCFSPTMYITEILQWVETRAKSELRMRLVPLNILKLSSIFFTDSSNAVGAAFVDRILLNLYFMYT